MLPDINLISGHYHSAPKTDANVRTRREKEGRCADCGLQTHRVEKKRFMTTKRVPLTIKDQVLRGRCLLCNPMPPPPPAAASTKTVTATTTIPTTPVNSNTTWQKPSSSLVVPPSAPVVSSQSTMVKTVSRPQTYQPSPYLAKPVSTGKFQETSVSLQITYNVGQLRETSDANVAYQACERLSIAACNPSNRELEVIKAGGIPAIISAMKRFPRSSEVQNRGIQAMGDLAAKGSSIIAKHNGFEAVIVGMESFWSNNRAAGMIAFKYMAQADKKLLWCGVDCRRLAHLIRRTGDDFDAAQSATRAILTLARYGFSQRRTLAEDMDSIAIILHLIRSHSSYRDNVELACYALAEIGSHEQKYANMLVQKGAILALVNIVKTCPSSRLWSRVAKASCDTLFSLSKFPSTLHIIRQLDVSTLDSLQSHFPGCQKEISKLRNKLK